MKRVLKINPFKTELYRVAKELVLKLRENGHKAYCVGGCARDTVMEIEPKEYDITTSATPDEVMSIFNHTIPVGVSFGVIIVIYKNFQFEVATFRKDENYADGRRPEKVTYSNDEEQDVIRRDFTINGMLLDPVAEEAIDYVGGLEDIEKGVLRTIGPPEERFDEDKLRMMRAVRFTSRYEFELESNTFASIQNLAAQINQVSVERIKDEIVKIITQKNPGGGLKLLSKTGLLKHILPEVEIMHGVDQPPEFHPEGDVFIHTCMVLDRLYEHSGAEIAPELAMGGLLHDVGKPPTFTISDRIRFNGHDKIGAEMSKKICRKLKFSNKQIEIIYSLIREHLKFKDVFNMRTSTLKRFIGMPYFQEHMALHLADCLASHGITKAYDFIVQQLNEFEEEEIKPKPLIGGNDLISIGYTPGPIFSEILHFVEESQLEGDITTPDDAIKAVTAKYPLN